MIYTMENTKKRGIRVQLFDADGQEQHMVIECNTETGRLVRWKPGPDGKRYRTAMLAPQRSSNLRVTVFFVDADGLYQEQWYVSSQNLQDTLPKDVEALWVGFRDVELTDYSAEFDRIEVCEEDDQPVKETVFVPAPLRVVVTPRYSAPFTNGGTR